MTKFTLFMAAITAFFTLSAGQMAAAHDGMHIEDAYVRVTGQSAKSAAVFMTLMNHSIEDDRLLSATSDVAERTELHTHTVNADGVMHMGEVTEGFPIAGQETHMLARAGDHIMLLGLTRPLTQGDTITLTLKFERGENLTITVPVDNTRKPGVPDTAAAPAMDGMAMPATN